MLKLPGPQREEKFCISTFNEKDNNDSFIVCCRNPLGGFRILFPLLRANFTSRRTLIGSPEKSSDFLGKRQNKIANIVFARKRQLHILF
jgi:hypothetical protein